jgi:hypothetical protein
MVPRQRFAPLVVLQHRRVEDLWYAAKARDLVGAWATRGELATARPEGFFGREEADALDEGAFDLAVVDGGVDGITNILIESVSVLLHHGEREADVPS